MSKFVEAFGKYLSDNVRQHPLLVRKLLAAAYAAVDASDHLPRKGLPGVQEPYVGAMAGLIAKGMLHPEQCVITNVFMPNELFAAFGITPIFPEIISVYAANTACTSIFAQIAEEGDVPDTFCSYHKVMVGMVESGVIGKPLFVANTTLACDANQISFRRVAEHFEVPRMVIDVPCRADEDAVRYVENQLYEMAAMCEDLCGRKLDARELRAAMERSARTMSAIKRYFSMRGEVSLPTTTTGVMCDMLATHCLSSDKASVRYAEGMERLAAEQLQRRGGRVGSDRVGTDAGSERASSVPRIFWIHTLPNWQMSMRQIFDHAAEVELVGVDFAIDSTLDADPEDPIGSMARRIVNNVNNGAGMQRIERALELAKQTRADGAVLFGHWGCKQTLGLSSLAKEVFEDAGIPLLVLDGDGCDPRNVADGQMVTRANAFVEQLKAAM